MLGVSNEKKKIIILSFRVGKSKNKNIDHGGKETCAFMLTQLTQVTYETDHISLLQDLVISSAQNFCFLCITVILKKY